LALEGDTDVDEENQEDSELETKPFERSSNRRALYYKPNTIYLQEEDQNEGKDKEEIHVSSFKVKASVELTTLLAAKKTRKADVMLKNRSLTISNILFLGL